MLQQHASFGDDTGYLKDLLIPLQGTSPQGLGPVVTAVNKGKPVWCQDFQNDAATVPWNARAKAAGLAALAHPRASCWWQWQRKARP